MYGDGTIIKHLGKLQPVYLQSRPVEVALEVAKKFHALLSFAQGNIITGYSMIGRIYDICENIVYYGNNFYKN